MKQMTLGGAAVALAMACATAALPLSEARAADVFVGYADNLRASGFFPTPWLGDPGVVSQTPAAESFDAAAVRIANTSGAPITIANMSVTLNPAGVPLVFNLWGPLVIPVGGNGIFTQTVSFDFDTSDFGGFGAFPPDSLAPTVPGNNQIGGCSSTAALLAASGFAAQCAANAPIVSFLEDGNPVSLTDTGHILDTGWWDFVNNAVFGEDGNESIGWNAIGSTPTRGGTGVPEPTSLALLGFGLAGLGALRRRS